MSELPVRAMILIVSTWALLFLVFVGFGLFIRRCFGLKIQDMESLLSSFWIGWAFTIFFLQLWHFYFRVDWRAFVLVSIGGIIGLFWNCKDFCHLIKEKFSKNWFFCFILLLTTLWIANHAILPPLNYDSGLYHLTSVRWATSFPIVPGLGNLLGRLAFNSSYFLYVAMLEIGPWAHKSHHLANGLLLMVLFAQIFLSGFKFFKKVGKVQLYHLFTILLVAPVLMQVLGVNISSPSPDLPIFILGIVLSVQLLAFLENSRCTRKENGYTVFFIATIAALGITIKLSFFALGITALLLAFVSWFVRDGSQDRFYGKKLFTWVTMSMAIALIPWMIRGVILSGYIAFPIPVGSFPVEWRISHADVVSMADWIRGWARTPKIPPEFQWNEVLGNWNWFIPWAIHMSKKWLDVILPLFLALVGCFLMLFWRLSKKFRRDTQRAVWLFLLPPVVSLVYWFVAAPHIRFVGSCFWILGAGIIALAVSYFNGSRSRVKLYIIFYLCVVLYLTIFLPIRVKKNYVETLIKEKGIARTFLQLHMNHIKKYLIIKPGENGGFYETPHVDLETVVTDSGLVIYMPKKGDQCWDAPLPCTPWPIANLRLRREGDMRYGFIVDPKSGQDMRFY